MKPKLKPDLDIETIQSSVIDEVVGLYDNGATSLRSVAKSMGFSMVKVRKILITAGVYSTETSSAVGAAFKDGLTVEEIAQTLNMSVSNVYLYLPYQTILYGLEERSVSADRQARYRERKKQDPSEPGKREAEEQRAENLDTLKTTAEERERKRSGIMYIGINEKLRKVLPKGFCSDEPDPYKNMMSVGFELEEPSFHMWNADIVTKGRGKNKKTAMVIENAACGFAVLMPVIPFSDSILSTPDADRDRREYQEALKAYREQVSGAIDTAIYDWMVAEHYPEQKATDALGERIVFVKSNDSFYHRVTELCEKIERNVETDPMELEPTRLNSGHRKFGNSPFYRQVEDETAQCLGLTAAEAMEMMRKKYFSARMNAEKLTEAGAASREDEA